MSTGNASAKFDPKQKKWDLRTIPIAKVRESNEALRDVDKSGEEFILLKESIAQRGILKPILVREIKDPETNTMVYGLCDGLQRFTACSELGMDSIPANVVNMQDGEVLEAQLIANARGVETKPVEYSKALTKILQQNPTLTKLELSQRLACSKPWLDQRLSLTKLDPRVAALVDEGKITVSNAVSISKLPADEQVENIDIAQTMSPTEFLGRTSARVKEIREANRKGRDPKPAEFVPVPFLRNLAATRSEWERPTLAPIVCSKMECETPEHGFTAGVAWVLNMDPDSIEVARQADIERKKKKAEEIAARKKERMEKKEISAAQVAAKAQVG